MVKNNRYKSKETIEEFVVIQSHLSINWSAQRITFDLTLLRIARPILPMLNKTKTKHVILTTASHC